MTREHSVNAEIKGAIYISRHLTNTGWSTDPSGRLCKLLGHINDVLPHREPDTDTEQRNNLDFEAGMLKEADSKGYIIEENEGELTLTKVR